MIGFSPTLAAPDTATLLRLQCRLEGAPRTALATTREHLRYHTLVPRQVVQPRDHDVRRRARTACQMAVRAGRQSVATMLQAAATTRHAGN